MQPKVIAVAAADLHLSHSPPIARSAEPDWYQSQRKVLREISQLADKHKCPLLISGDFFHVWNSPAALINLAIEELTCEVICIPGQHDLASHELATFDRTALCTLQAVEGFTVLLGNHPMECKGFTVYGFGWNTKAREPRPDDSGIRIALVHAYRWKTGAGHAQASEADRVDLGRNPYPGFDVVIIGDNHIAWQESYKDKETGRITSLFNCGSLMRRNADQADHQPRIGLIKSDGTVESHYLSLEGEIFDADHAGPKNEQNHSERFKSVLDEMRDMRNHTLDFLDELERSISSAGLTEGASRIILEEIDNAKQVKT